LRFFWGISFLGEGGRDLDGPVDAKEDEESLTGPVDAKKMRRAHDPFVAVIVVVVCCLESNSFFDARRNPKDGNSAGPGRKRGCRRAFAVEKANGGEGKDVPHGSTVHG
jgi:hypothetical protein